MTSQDNFLKNLNKRSYNSTKGSNISLSNTLTEYLNGWITYDYDQETGEWSGETTGPSMSEMWYTSANGSVITPYMWNFGGVGLTGNTYNEEEGGRMSFNNRVSTIGYGAFYGRSNFKTIKLPCFLKVLDKQCFASCSSLSYLRIPHTVQEIGQWAFSECTSLKAVSMPDSLKTLRGSAFYGCTSLTDITLPKHITTMGSYVFERCTGLIHASIKAPLTYLPEGIFIFCESLKSVELPSSLERINAYAFQYCESLTGITLPDSITDLGVSAFLYCPSMKELRLPAALTEVKEGICQYCYDLAKVTFPTGLTKIGKYAFSRCYCLTDVVIPDSVTEIAQEVFFWDIGITGLTLGPNVAVLGAGTGVTYGDVFPYLLDSVAVHPDNTHFKVVNDAVYSMDGTELYGGADWTITTKYTDYEVPEGVKVVMPGAFRSVAQDPSLEIQDRIDELFEYCQYKRPHINLSDGILTSMTFPSTCVYIGEFVMSDAKLSSVTVKAVTPPTLQSKSVFGYGCSDPTWPIYVPAGSVEAYKAANLWSELAARIQPIEES